jgi:release factor glutamine methyltransferase
VNARAAARIVAATLTEAGIPDASIESELLVRHAASLTRSQYFADTELAAAATAMLDNLLQRRLRREPAAYISGTREFYGLAFEVTAAVLIPRPETELLVEIALGELKTAPDSTVVDVGTGSGAVAVAIAANAPASVVATDVSAGALALARRNARRNALPVQFLRSNLATAIGHADIVVANLPYIPTREIPQLQPEVRDWEPRIALDGGADGLDLVRVLIADCAKRLHPRLLALEVALGQADAVACLGRSFGARAEILNDLAGIERVVCLRWA